MPDPVFTFFHDGSTPSTGTLVSSGNPLDFGDVQIGLISDTVELEIWNDRAGLLSSDTAVAPRFYALSGPDDLSAHFAGTDNNDHLSMIEARSCGAYGVAADQQSDWTPIGPNFFLVLGDMPSGSMRRLELRLRVPADANVDAQDMDFHFWLA